MADRTTLLGLILNGLILLGISAYWQQVQQRGDHPRRRAEHVAPATTPDLRKTITVVSTSDV